MTEVREDIWQRYVLVSHLLLALAICHITMQAPGLYETVNLFISNKSCMVVAYNYAFMLFTVICRIPVLMFIGRLATVETEQLVDMARNYLMDAVIFLVLSKPRLNGRELPLGSIIKYLTLLVALKSFHVLIYIRLNNMFQMDIPSYWSILRLCTFIYLMAMTDLRLLTTFWDDINFKNTFTIWLVFELFAMLLLCVFSAMRFVVNLLDHYYEAGLGNKTTINFYLELLHDALSLSFFTVFMAIFYVHNPNNMPAYMVIDIIHVVKNLTERVTLLMHYRQMVAIMESKYPKPTQEEKDADGTCIICRDVFDDDARKIECGHIFHLSCLKSWLFQHSTCPTCRAPIKAELPEHKQRSAISRAMIRVERKIHRALLWTQRTTKKIITRIKLYIGDDPETKNLRKFMKNVTAPIAQRILAELRREKVLCEFSVGDVPVVGNDISDCRDVFGDNINQDNNEPKGEVIAKAKDPKTDAAYQSADLDPEHLHSGEQPIEITERNIDTSVSGSDHMRDVAPTTNYQSETLADRVSDIKDTRGPIDSSPLNRKKKGSSEGARDETSDNDQERPSSGDDSDSDEEGNPEKAAAPYQDVTITDTEQFVTSYEDVMMELSGAELQPLVHRLDLPEWIRESCQQRVDPNKKNKAELVKILKKLNVIRKKLMAINRERQNNESSNSRSSQAPKTAANSEQPETKAARPESGCDCKSTPKPRQLSPSAIREIRIAKLSGNATEAKVTFKKEDRTYQQEGKGESNKETEATTAGVKGETECTCEKSEPKPEIIDTSDPSSSRNVPRASASAELPRSFSNTSRNSSMGNNDLPSIAVQSFSGSNFSSLSLLPSSIEVPPVTPSLVRTNPNVPTTRTESDPDLEPDAIEALLNEFHVLEKGSDSDILIPSNEENDELMLSHITSQDLEPHMLEFYVTYGKVLRMCFLIAEGLSRSDERLQRAFATNSRMTMAAMPTELQRNVTRDIVSSIICGPITRERLQELHNEYTRRSFIYQDGLWRLGRSDVSLDVIENVITSMSIMTSILADELEKAAARKL